MGDIKLFRVAEKCVEELAGHIGGIEKSLQTLIERHLEDLLGVRFLASEYSTGKTHGERIDTLGIDENGFPVIIEYEHALNENVINQGLFYLNWLLDHRDEFEQSVVSRYGTAGMSYFQWSDHRLLCVARDFTLYDEYAIQEINRNIELIRYRLHDNDLLLLELVRSAPAPDASSNANPSDKGVLVHLEQSPTSLITLFTDVENFILTLGDDVQRKILENYVAYRRIKNLACVEVRPETHAIVLYLRVNAYAVALEPGFTDNPHGYDGLVGLTTLEVQIKTQADLERAKPYILASYEAS